MKNNFLSFLLVFILSSCAHQESFNNRDYQIGAYLWQQRSGEYKALCYQAYNIAKFRLARELENKHNRKRAVVFDIDETILDNSREGAYQVKNNLAWSTKSEDAAIKRAESEAIVGARDFIEFAIQNRVEVIYLSNRRIDQINDTIENFKKLSIKYKPENMYFMNGDWSKEKRREMIRKKFDVILYFGDNLHDFDAAFDSRIESERNAAVESHSQDFGEKFIVLPNPMYGDWESVLPRTPNKRDLLILK